VRRWGPHGVVAGMEEDRRQRCAWGRSRQLGRRGVVGDQLEERSVVLFDGSMGSAVVGLGCGVTERRGAVVDLVAGVRECAGYSSGGIGREASSSAWRARATWPIAWGGTWSSSDTRHRQRRRAREVRTARSEQRRLDALSRGARSEDAGLSESYWGRHCSTRPGPIQCTVLFCNYSHFAPISKYKVKTIPLSKIIETWHGARVHPSKQFLPSGPLLILNRIQVIKLGTTPL
jgi:hypothetical protein